MFCESGRRDHFFENPHIVKMTQSSWFFACALFLVQRGLSSRKPCVGIDIARLFISGHSPTPTFM